MTSGREAEVQLAGLEILVQDPVQIRVAAAFARDGRVELSTAGGGDDLDQPFRTCLAVFDEAHRKQSRAPILRHEARVTALVVAGRVEATPAARISPSSSPTFSRNAGSSMVRLDERTR